MTSAGIHKPIAGIAVTIGAMLVSLFAGAGLAHADYVKTWFTPGGGSVGPMATVEGVIYDMRGGPVNGSPAAADCTYRATPDPMQNPLLLPPYVHNFRLDAAPAPGYVSRTSWEVTHYDSGLPAVPTGTKWNVHVQCISVASAILRTDSTMVF